MFTQEQRDQLNSLMDYRDEISDSVFHIDRILKIYFPDEYEAAYQHWIPQILTALSFDNRWLPRGQINMQQTIDRIVDKMKQDSSNGVSKYI